MIELKELIKECEKLDREDRQKAEEYYRTIIFPEVKNIVKERAKEDRIGTYKGLILTTGFSPEPLILTITALEPEKVFFLYTKDSEKYLDRIVNECRLSPAQFDKAEIERFDGLDVYEVVKRWWNERGNKKVALDITGGTKAMVGGASVAGTFLAIDLLYVDSKFGWIPGKSYPGSERIVKLRNPFDVFGDLEEREGVRLFNGHNFTGCESIFGKLKGLCRDPRRFEYEVLLSQGYGAWDQFDFDEGYSKIHEAQTKAKRYGIPYDRRLDKQLEIIRILRNSMKKDFFDLLKDSDSTAHLLADLFCNAERRFEQGRYDDAIIRLYRILELIAQHRLASKGIDTGNVCIEEHEVRAEFEDLTEKIYGARRGISDKIGLMDACILLCALKDELFDEDTIKKLKNQLSIRNELLIEHRGGLGTEKNYRLFRSYVKNWLNNAVEIENLDDFIADHRFVKL
jgi:CRISPR-associated protein (TIGR02710 family)